MSAPLPTDPHAAAADTAGRYLSALKSAFPIALPKNTHFICVGHVTAENNLFLRELAKSGKVTLIPKATIEKPEDVAALKTIRGVTHVDKFNLRGPVLQAFFRQRHTPDSTKELKDMLRNPELAVEFMKRYTSPGEKLVVLDVGGYFANSMPHLELASQGRHPEGWALPGREICAATEVTVNGEYKYRMASAHTQVPVLSFAKSLTKHPENEIVGPSCVRGTAEALAQLPQLNPRLHGREASHGVLAVGEVGSQIVHYLRKQYGLTTRIHDINAERMRHLSESGHQGVDKAQLLAESDLLYVAPPAPVLTVEEIATMKDGAVLSFATSIDDVVKDHHRLRDYPSKPVLDKDGIEICRTYHIGGKDIHLICNGRSPNFYLHHPVDPTVILSLGLILPSLAQLFDKDNPPSRTTVNTLAAPTQQRILDVWKAHYPQAHAQVDFTGREEPAGPRHAEAARAKPSIPAERS